MTWRTRPRSDLGGGLVGHRAGSGPPLMLVHGVGMRAEFWSDLLPRLTPHFTVTVPDLPGHGRSPRLEVAPPALSRYGDALADVLADTPTDASSMPGAPSIVIGHSLGALLALDLAVRHPRLVGGLGVFNGVYRRGEAARAAVRERAAELGRDGPSDHSSTLRRWFGDEPASVDREAAVACRHWLAEADPDGYRDAYRVFAESDAPDDDALRGIEVPTLIATGALETNSTPSMARTLTALLPDARCLVVEEARHMMPMTHGDILLAALLDRFTESGAHD